MVAETQISLAPAAGAGIGKLLAEALLADPEFLPLMKKAAIGGLSAMRSYYDKSAGGCVTEPDHRVQVQTMALLLAHMEGEPIKRIVHQHLGGDGSGVDPLGALRDSPALLAAVERTLEKAKWRTSGRSDAKRPVKSAEAIELE